VQASPKINALFPVMWQDLVWRWGMQFGEIFGDIPLTIRRNAVDKPDKDED